MNRLVEPEDTSSSAAVPEAWTVGSLAAGAPWHRLPAGGLIELALRAAAGCCERIELELRAPSGAVDLAQLWLGWESSPAPAANEAGQRPRALDGAVPLAALRSPIAMAAQRRPELPKLEVFARPDAGGAWRLALQLPMPYAGGLRIYLRRAAADGAAADPVECRWRISGRSGLPPADGRYLRAGVWEGSAAPAPATEQALFESHGRGQVAALIAGGIAAMQPEAWTLTWYIDGDERLQQIEEQTGRQLFEGAPPAVMALPAFADYIKCTLRWHRSLSAAAPTVGATESAASFLLLAHVEDRPIA